MRTYDDIKRAVIGKGYKFFIGEMLLNFVFERTNDEITNKFTDLWHIAYQHGNQNLILTIPCTTKAGLKGAILQPVTVEGVTGTAIIEPGQYINSHRFVDKFDGFSKYPYFQQVGKLNYWRDGDKDTHIDKVQEQKNKIFGTNLHRMSQVGVDNTNLTVDNWSLGCMGSPEPQFAKVLPLTRASVDINKSHDVSVTLMESKDFISI